MLGPAEIVKQNPRKTFLGSVSTTWGSGGGARRGGGLARAETDKKGNN
jgi:hypothetical protein